ncbi:TetR/AcrR family transcriptional regulator [Streptomyces sp. DH10]|uniref:TetR/AcrR family transcriptional regulator n=1 Tax=Streptomyces sp. DH10 TaxID=3040121 RepID=UPI002442AD1E|nr:TetR/AcrR family transcriptional regulator [Streptomyces sp. DH10]MDG9709246.1 TetR/AcrR family transcriptional regulator [Streptomyces sp. DH10]
MLADGRRPGLLDRAAHMLRTRQPVTLRTLVAGTGVSTMAVYTYFGGMDGLRKALRQEGFTHLAAQLAAVKMSADPVRDLAALGAAYLANALENPDLYRVMFDAGFDLEDTGAADETLDRLVRAIDRARTNRRFHDEVDPLELATQSWTIGHGLASLVATGPLPHQALTHTEPRGPHLVQGPLKACRLSPTSRDSTNCDSITLGAGDAISEAG